MQSHHLLAQAEADTASFFLSSEERDEHLPGYLRSDFRAVVGHFDADDVLGIHLGTEADFAFLSLSDGLYGILQQIGHDLCHHALVGKGHEVFVHSLQGNADVG